MGNSTPADNRPFGSNAAKAASNKIDATKNDSGTSTVAEIAAARGAEAQADVDTDQRDTTGSSWDGIPSDTTSNDSKSFEKFFGQYNGPWDARISYGYNYSTQIGNDMPNENTPPTDPNEKGVGIGSKQWKGSPSLANPYALIRFDDAVVGKDARTHHQHLFDYPTDNKKDSKLLYKNPTSINIIKWSKQKENRSKPYFHSDFIYCKYFGLIPNNYMVTLRRYPAPVLDNYLVGGPRNAEDRDNPILPIAQMVTWLGEETGNKLSDILKMKGKINWKEIQAEVYHVEGNEVGAEASGSGFLQKSGQLMGILTGGANFSTISGQGQQQAKYDPYDGGPYANRVYGGVNVISKTKARDRGLDFENQITLNFHYVLESIGGVNAKKALLDQLANILSVVYNNAAFWGGANRYFPNVPQYPFLGGSAGKNAWFSGNPAGFMKAVGSQLQEGLSKITDVITSLAESPSKAFETLQKLASGGAKLFAAHLQHGNRPAILSIRSLLTGEPVGEWHLTIGNPMKPIAVMGNMIVTDFEIELSDQLGADDFPEELKISVTLEHGKPRDKGDIESIFNNGMGRLYYPYAGTENPWNLSSSTRNSKIDTSWKKHQPTTEEIQKGIPKVDIDSRGYIGFNSTEEDLLEDSEFKNIDGTTTTVAERRFGVVGVVDPSLNSAAKLATDMGFRNAAEAYPNSKQNVSPNPNP